MALQLFMRINLIYFIVFFALSCVKNGNNISDKTKEIISYDKIEIKDPEFLYDINLDSFDFIMNKIKWGQSFSDILSINI